MAEPKMFDTSLRMAAPGPRGRPLVNNLRFLATAHRYAMTTLAPFHDQPIAPITVDNASIVVALGEAAVKQVVTDNATFHRASAGVFNLPAGQPWSKMFEGIITYNEDEHRRRRRLLMPVVHRSAMDHYR
jgi:cytochrome P450